MENLYSVIPAAKRLDKIDKDDVKLERDLALGEISLSAYAIAKRALILKRNKEWALYCRAVGWPIEYNPLTRDPESMIAAPVAKPPIRDWDYVGPANPPDEIDENPVGLDLPANRRRLHYLIFWLEVLLLSGLYWWLGG